MGTPSVVSEVIIFSVGTNARHVRNLESNQKGSFAMELPTKSNATLFQSLRVARVNHENNAVAFSIVLFPQ